MDLRVVSFVALCGLLGQPAGALGSHQPINPKKPGEVAHDPNTVGGPALPLAPGASRIDPRRPGGAALDPNVLGEPASPSRGGASPKPAPPVEGAHRRGVLSKLTGTISSVSDTRLVLSHTARGKKTTTTFVLNPATIKQGNLKRGARVTVSYRSENNNKVARRVQAEATKKPTKSSAQPAGKSPKSLR